MSRTTLGFIYSSLFYLGLGVALGVLMVLAPELAKLKAVHAHLNQVGFVIFMIFGIAYHILPRFRGKPLHSERLGWLQLWLSHAGLVGFLLFSALEAYTEVNPVFRGFFAGLLGLSFYLFIYNIARTLLGAPRG